MFKFYSKKPISQEESPILVPLQRRHTVMEGDQDTMKLQPAFRSNSTSSVDRSQRKPSEAPEEDTFRSTSPDSTASTVVITESVLASSWLYKNKKEEMNVNDTLTTCDSSTRLTPDKIQRPKRVPRPNVITNMADSKRSKRCSSCCCYALVVLMISVAVLGILSAIGSIVYAKFFSGSVNNETETVEFQNSKNDDFYPMRRLEQPSKSILFGNSRPPIKNNKSPAKKVSLDNSNLKQGIEETTEAGLNSNHSDIHRQVMSVSNEILSTVHSSDRVLKDQHAGNENDQTGLNEVNASLPLSNFVSNEESPYSKLFELYKDFYNNHSKNPSNSNSRELTDVSESKLSSENSTPLGHEEQLGGNDSAESSNTKTENGSNSRDLEVVTVKKSQESDSPETSKEQIINSEKSELLSTQSDLKASEILKSSASEDGINSISQTLPENLASKENQENEFEPSLFTQQPLKPFQTSEEIESTDSEINENGFRIAQPTMPGFLFQETEDSNLDEFNSFKFDYDDQNPTDGKDNFVDKKSLWNRPVLETNIAVPGPIEAIERLNAKDQDMATDSSKMDRQFSLAKALERLRLLDASGTLPSSRQKTDNADLKKSNPVIQSKEELVTERSTYLSKLRKRFFDTLIG